MTTQDFGALTLYCVARFTVISSKLYWGEKEDGSKGINGELRMALLGWLEETDRG